MRRRTAVVAALAFAPLILIAPLADADPATPEPNSEPEATATASPTPTETDEPEEFPGHGPNWYLTAMQVEEAHELSTGEDVIVAVVDTGVDRSHPDLEGKVLDGVTMTEDGPQPGRGNIDVDGHGTAMAGLIAGSGVEVLGVAPGVTILPVRIERDRDGSLDPDLVYEGVRWAIDNGASIINLSLRGKQTLDTGWKRELIGYAIDNNAVLVAAAGNKTDDEVRVGEPASIPGVVAVSGMNKVGHVWSGSVTGDSVVVCAPAEALPHIQPGTPMKIASGTSGAAALVSGVAALIRSRYPSASAADIINRLIYTAVDVTGDGRDPGFGYGAVDAYGALTAVVAPTDQYPLELPSDVTQKPAIVATENDVGGWWLGTPMLVAILAGGGAIVWLVRRSRDRHLVPTDVPTEQQV